MWKKTTTKRWKITITALVILFIVSIILCFSRFALSPRIPFFRSFSEQRRNLWLPEKKVAKNVKSWEVNSLTFFQLNVSRGCKKYFLEFLRMDLKFSWVSNFVELDFEFELRCWHSGVTLVLYVFSRILGSSRLNIHSCIFRIFLCDTEQRK